VKNITVSVDDQIYRRARIIAAERGTSVSALVQQFLGNLTRGGDENERLKQAEALLREGITEFRAGDRLPRDELHQRER
jgi:predicted transcriptional regulator